MDSVNRSGLNVHQVSQCCYGSSQDSCITSTDPRQRSRLWDPVAVCRLSTYTRRRNTRVKYQEHLKQTEGLAVRGARAGKCTFLRIGTETK